MQYQKLDRFYASIAELESSFAHVRKQLRASQSVPVFVLERLDTYHEICSRQKEYGEALRLHLADENFEEVAHKIKLINALSLMIMEDVQEFILQLQDLNIDIEIVSDL